MVFLLQFIQHNTDSTCVIWHIYIRLILNKNWIFLSPYFCPIYFFSYFFIGFIDHFTDFTYIHIEHYEIIQ